MSVTRRDPPHEELNSGTEDNAQLGAVMLILLLLGLALVVAIIVVVVFLV